MSRLPPISDEEFALYQGRRFKTRALQQIAERLPELPKYTPKPYAGPAPTAEGATAVAEPPTRAPAATAPVATQDPRKQILETAQKELGKRYAGPIIGEPDAARWGDPGWDCSSFVAGVYRKFGIQLTPFTDAIAGQTTKVDTKEAQPGDIILYRYNDPYQKGVQYPHTGIYIGNGQMIDASVAGGVKVRPLLDKPYEIRRAPGIENLGNSAVPEAAIETATTDVGSLELPPIDKSSRDSFIKTATPYALRAQADTGIPANIMIGIAVNEGAAAKDTVASNYNNFFGIKATPDWQGKTTPTMNAWEVVGGRNTTQPSTFRAYDDPADSFRDFGAFLQTNPRYAEALKHTDDPAAFVRSVHAAGYATDPAWADKVLSIAKTVDVSGPMPAPTRPGPTTPPPPERPSADTWLQRAQASVDSLETGYGGLIAKPNIPQPAERVRPDFAAMAQGQIDATFGARAAAPAAPKTTVPIYEPSPPTVSPPEAPVTEGPPTVASAEPPATLTAAPTPTDVRGGPDTMAAPPAAPPEPSFPERVAAGAGELARAAGNLVPAVTPPPVVLDTAPSAPPAQPEPAPVAAPLPPPEEPPPTAVPEGEPLMHPEIAPGTAVDMRTGRVLGEPTAEPQHPLAKVGDLLGQAGQALSSFFGTAASAISEPQRTSAEQRNAEAIQAGYPSAAEQEITASTNEQGNLRPRYGTSIEEHVPEFGRALDQPLPEALKAAPFIGPAFSAGEQLAGRPITTRDVLEQAGAGQAGFQLPFTGGIGRAAKAIESAAPAAERAVETVAPSVAGRVAELAQGGTEALPAGARPIAMTTEENVARLRLDKFPEEVRQTIADSAKATDFAEMQRRGVISDQAAANLADAVSESRPFEQWIAEGSAGKAYSQEEIIALKNATIAQAAKVDDLTRALTEKAYAGESTDNLFVQTAHEIEKLQALTTVREGAKAESGRSLRAWQAQGRLVDLSPAEGMAQIAERFGGREGVLSAAQEYQALVHDGADLFQLAKFWSSVGKPPPGVNDYFRLLRYNAMLSGPRTLQADAISLALEVPFRLLRDFGASTLRGHPEEMGPELQGLWVGIQKGLGAAGQVLRHGITMEQAAGERGFYPTVAERATGIGKPIAMALETPLRVLQVGNEIGRAAGYAMQVGREAGRAASAEGLRGSRWSGAVAEYLQNIEAHPDTMERARNVGDRIVFQSEMGSFGRLLSRFQQNPIGNVIVPFLRIPYNITARGIETSPLGLIGTGIDVARGAYGRTGSQLTAALGGAPAKIEGITPLGERLGDNLLGTFGTAALVNQGLQGNITASGPDDPARRADLEAQGWRPYSIRIGGVYHDYANTLGRFAIPLALIGSVAEAGLYGKPDAGVAAKAADAAHRLTRLVEEQTYIRGVGAIIQAIHDPERYGPQWLDDFVGSLVPYGSALSTVAQATEQVGSRQPVKFDIADPWQHVAQALERRLPGLREHVPVRLDALGRPALEPYQGAAALVRGQHVAEAPEPILQESERLAKLGFHTAISQLQPTIQGAPLTPEQQKVLQQEYGAQLQKMLPDILKSGSYQRAKPEIQARIFARVTDHAAQIARARLLQNAEIRSGVREARLKRAGALS